MIKSLVNRFIKIFRKKSFEDSTIEIITYRLKKEYGINERKTFRNWGDERKVKFTSIVGKRKEVNNNAIESHHSQQKEFHKVKRGVKEVQDY